LDTRCTTNIDHVTFPRYSFPRVLAIGHGVVDCLISSNQSGFNRTSSQRENFG